MTSAVPHILVIGSANVDFTVKVERLPQVKPSQVAIFCCPTAARSQSGAGSPLGWGAGVHDRQAGTGCQRELLYQQLIASG
jgi:hypothetical protein